MKRGRILRIRPFNMANYSGGSDMLISIYFMDLIALIPYYWVITSLTIFHNKEENGEYDKIKLRKRLNHAVLPIMLIPAFLWTGYLLMMLMGYEGIKNGLPLFLLCGLMPTVVSYVSLRLIIGIMKNLNKVTLYLTGLLFLLLGVIASIPIYLLFQSFTNS